MTDSQHFPVPSNPGGRVQRAIPAPFQRPSVTIGAGPDQVHRQWRNILVCDIHDGDIVPDIGRIVAVDDIIGDVDSSVFGATYHPWCIRLTGADGLSKTYPANELIFAFTAVTR